MGYGALSPDCELPEGQVVHAPRDADPVGQAIARKCVAERQVDRENRVMMPQVARTEEGLETMPWGDITGTWDIYSGPLRRQLRINVAGRTVVGRFTDYGSLDTGKARSVKHGLVDATQVGETDDLEPIYEYELHNTAGLHERGRWTVSEGGDRLSGEVLNRAYSTASPDKAPEEYGLGAYQAMRSSSDAVPPDVGYMAQYKDREQARAAATAPLVEEDIERLEQIVAALRVDLPGAFVGSNMHTRRHIDAGAFGGRTQKLVREFFGDYRSHESAQTPAVRAKLIEMLKAERLTIDDTTRSMHDLVLTLCAQAPTFTRGLQRILGVTFAAQGAVSGGDQEYEHQYRFKMNIGGVGADVGPVGVGGYLGYLYVEKLSGDTWQTQLSLVLGKGGTGVGLGFDLGFESGWTNFSLPSEWQAKDFNSSVALLGVSREILHKGKGTGYIRFGGTDVTGPALVECPPDVFDARKVGLSVDAAGIVGYAFTGVTRDGETQPAAPPEATVSHTPVARFHYPVDQHEFTSEHRRRLEVFLAEHRQLLEDKSTRIRVLGHASRTGSADYNYMLASSRAQGAASAIRASLPAHLRPEPEQEVKRSYGEKAAEEVGDQPNDFENPAWRRVDVVIDADLAVVQSWRQGAE